MDNINVKNDRGITLITLAITIIVILIISGIAVNTGISTVKNANLESMKTNMLLLKAKTKEYVEEANFIQGKDEGQIKQEAIDKLEGTQIANSADIADKADVSSNLLFYTLSKRELLDMGLNTLEPEEYIVAYDVKGASVEIIAAEGFKYNGVTYYKLSDLEQL